MEVLLRLLIVSLGIQRSLCTTGWSVTDELEDGRVVIIREVDLEEAKVTFTLRAETTGWVGFGLSPSGGMRGADIVIGGITPQGHLYFNDFHGEDKMEPIRDKIENWSVIEGNEMNGTWTEIKFSRKFETCDAEDVPITEDTLSIIWALGSSDDLEYHGAERRGTFRVNLLNPPMPSSSSTTPNKFQEWRIRVNDEMRAGDTSYMCSIHAAPNYNKIHHVVGFDALLESPEALRHTHHFNLWKCRVGPGMERDFEAAVGAPAFDCTSAIPHPLYTFCQKHLYVWAKGGHRTMFPEDVGLELVEVAGQDEYYMLEIHYDNPAKVSNLQFQTGLTVYHTQHLREKTAGVLVIGHQVSYRHTIPPNSRDFLTVGHCSSECTEVSLPKDGINVFNILLHSHLSGRKLKLRQFRDGVELPWFAVDDNFDFNFQQNRPFKTEKQILPGDHLTYECRTDTTWKRGGEVTVGYLATTDEMCETFLLYYPKMEMDYCASGYPVKNLLQDFRFHNFTGLGSTVNRNDPIITGPEPFKGRNYTDVLTNVVDWTAEFRSHFQDRVVHADHEAFCAVSRNMGLKVRGMTRYPNVTDYQKPKYCGNGGSVSKSFGTLAPIFLLFVIIKWYGI